MAHHFLLLLSFILLITFSFSQRPSFQNAMVLPVTKDFSTLQYLTHLYIATPSVPINLVVDLGGPFLWIDCASGSSSSSHQSIGYGSLQCSRAKSYGCGGSGNTCTLTAVNTITRVIAGGELAEDTVAVNRGLRLDQINSITTVDHFLFSCAPSFLLKGLPSGVNGMLGLGRTRIALPSQLAAAFGLHRRLTVCLSPSDGVILSGYRPTPSLLRPGVVWNSLTYTPLISNPDGTLHDYYINLKSIKINGNRLSLNASKLSIKTKLSTVVPYTTMESTIYGRFTEAFVRASTSMNMTRVAAVPPFGVCFRSGGIKRTRVGPAVPAIDLVMQSEMVKWRVDGGNSMVEVSDGVMCLGVLDGGLNPRNSIVIGGYQLEDNLLEFNLATSMLGFSSSLLIRETSCSEFKLYSLSGEVESKTL